jgi:ferredoxin-NADP reductase
MQEIIAQNNYKKVYFVHCVRDGSFHSHRNKVAKLQQQSKNNISSLRVYSRPRDIDTKVTLNILLDLNRLLEYY